MRLDVIRYEFDTIRYDCVDRNWTWSAMIRDMIRYELNQIRYDWIWLDMNQMWLGMNEVRLDEVRYKLDMIVCELED